HPMGGGNDRLGGPDTVGVDGPPYLGAVRAGAGRVVRIHGGNRSDPRPVDARARAAAARAPRGTAGRPHDLPPPSACDGESRKVHGTGPGTARPGLSYATKVALTLTLFRIDAHAVPYSDTVVRTTRED